MAATDRAEKRRRAADQRLGGVNRPRMHRGHQQKGARNQHAQTYCQQRSFAMHAVDHSSRGSLHRHRHQPAKSERVPDASGVPALRRQVGGEGMDPGQSGHRQERSSTTGPTEGYAAAAMVVSSRGVLPGCFPAQTSQFRMQLVCSVHCRAVWICYDGTGHRTEGIQTSIREFLDSASITSLRRRLRSAAPSHLHEDVKSGILDVQRFASSATIPAALS